MDEISTWSRTWRVISYMVSWNFCQAHLHEVGLTRIPGGHESFFSTFSSMRDLKTNCRVDFRTEKHHQVILSNWYSLRHIIFKPNPPLFFRQQNMQWSLQHGPFSLHTMLEGPWLHSASSKRRKQGIRYTYFLMKWIDKILSLKSMHDLINVYFSMHYDENSIWR